MAILTATTTLLPPLSVKPSVSMATEDSVFDRLGATPLPDKEINAILNLHENLSLDQVINDFDKCMEKMARWLETAQLAVFTLELNLKQDQPQVEETQSMLELAFGRMEPLISILVEVEPILEDKLDDAEMDTTAKKMHTRMAITKIQSEWSGLQHFLTSVLKQLDSMNEKKELTYLMENVLRQIDDLSIMMFQFQEKRHAAAIDNASEAMSSPLSSVSSCFSPSTTTTTNTTLTANTAATSLINEPTIKDEHILAEIDNKVEPLFNDVQKIYASMTSHSPPEDPSGMLSRKHHMVQHRWEALRVEIDDLKEELKEDRWLTVFRQVADQVDVMIDGLDKTVQQCYTIIHQTREWHAAQPTNALDRLSKTIMRSLPRNSQASNPVPVDREKFRSVEKNFEAKYKYYTPSIGKMLGMLGSGIVSRVARDNVTSKRHASMTQRWTTLKTQMDTLRNKDLPDTERLLEPQSAPHSGWKSIRYRSPEPGDTARAKGLSNSLPKTNHSAVPRRQNNDDDYRRVRSVTPSGDLRSRMYSPVPRVPQQPRAASSLAYTRENLRPSASESSSIDSVISHMRKPIGHESKSFGVQEPLQRRKSRVPKADDIEASWMKPTKSTLMRARRTQSVDHGEPKRPKTPVRSKTPNPGNYSRKSITPVPLPSRPKSSMGSRQVERTVSPMRRTMTPSLIPRPKTPSSSTLRCASPSLIPRPRSSMHHYQNESFLSVPPDHSPPSSPHLKKKQSMPALMHRTTSPFRMTHVPSMRAASPQYRRRRLSEDENFRLARGQQEVYTPNARDPLDVEVARIVNASPITVKCQKGPLGGGRYYFGNELNPSVGGGKKLYTCKLMNYADRDSRRSKAPQNKVLVRVGGGWQDLEMFLLDHSNLMTATSDVVSRRLFK